MLAFNMVVPAAVRRVILERGTDDGAILKTIACPALRNARARRSGVCWSPMGEFAKSEIKRRQTLAL